MPTTTTRVQYRDVPLTLHRASVVTPYTPDRRALCAGDHPATAGLVPEATGLVLVVLNPGGLLAECPLCPACLAALPEAPSGDVAPGRAIIP